MEHHKNDLNSLINWNPFRSHRDEKTHIKIHRHLTDINDTISEQDIRDIKIVTVAANITETVLNKLETKLIH